MRKADAGDLRARYDVYRVNADHALVAIALFDQPWLGVGRRIRPQNRECSRLESRGKCYYAIAASTERKLKYGATAVSDVLTKLSDRFELYARILTRVRSSHLNLFARIPIGEAFHLERTRSHQARPEPVSGRIRELVPAVLDERSEVGEPAGRIAGGDRSRLRVQRSLATERKEVSGVRLSVSLRLFYFRRLRFAR